MIFEAHRAARVESCGLLEYAPGVMDCLSFVNSLHHKPAALSSAADSRQLQSREERRQIAPALGGSQSRKKRKYMLSSEMSPITSHVLL